MKGVLDKIEAFWKSLDTPRAMLLGLALGVATTILPHLLFGEIAIVIGFLSIFPFFLRALLMLLLIFWSASARERIVGQEYAYRWPAAHLAYCRGKYFLFLIAWWFTIILYGCWLQGDC